MDLFWILSLWMLKLKDESISLKVWSSCESTVQQQRAYVQQQTIFTHTNCNVLKGSHLHLQPDDGGIAPTYCMTHEEKDYISTICSVFKNSSVVCGFFFYCLPIIHLNLCSVLASQVQSGP